MIEVLEAMKVVEIPGNRGVFAIDLEGVERLVAAGITGGLEGRQRTVGEPGQERAGIVDPDLFDLAGELWTRSLTKVSVMALTESMPPLSQRAVSMQWASRSPVTPLPAALTSRRHRASPPWGNSFGDGPVLEELGAVMEDPAEPPFIDEPFGEGHGGTRR
jgi:hypothetical protein